MDFGTALFPTDLSISVAELAAETESRGFESFWVPEHTHIPTSRESPWPGGDELPEHYSRTLDPFVALTVAAIATKQIKLGFGICLLVERDPIVTANAAASIDFLSGGRVLFGVGGGWNLEEMRNHGTDPRRRWALLRERVLAMQAIWSQDVAEFHGEMVDFGPLWSWPKPVQQPLPVHVGGNHANTLRRAVEWGDGWMPNYGRSDVAAQVVEFRRMSEEAGRGRLPVTIYGVAPNPSELEEFGQAGIDRAVFWMPSSGRDAALRHLEKVTAVVAALS